MTAGATGLPVIAGPAEATAAGNVLVQAIALGHIASRHEAREIVRRSFALGTHEPEDTDAWEEARLRLRERSGRT
jgi:rhamnulokinase